MSATKKLTRGARAYLRERFDGLVVWHMRSTRTRRLTPAEREALSSLLRNEQLRERDRYRQWAKVES